MWKKYLQKAFVIIISFYLSFSSFILVKIITNDIILNSYKAYAEVKLNSNKFINTAENLSEKGKILLNKLLNKEKAQELEKNHKNNQLLKEKELEELRKELEFNQKVLSLLPYIIAIIIFLITFIKVDDYSDKFLKKLSK